MKAAAPSRLLQRPGRPGVDGSRAVQGMMRRVATTLAELSSITSTLTELTRRVAALAERARADAGADLATQLFAIERDLRAALRRLERATPERRSRST